MKLKLLFCIFFLVIISFSCKKEERPNIPAVAVDVYLNINSTMYLELKHTGGWVNITGGYRGITVYRYGPDEFIAFERTCPYDPEIESAFVVVDSSGLTLSDVTCGSRFLILDGSVITGPSTLPLLQYQTYYDGSYLHIYN